MINKLLSPGVVTPALGHPKLLTGVQVLLRDIADQPRKATVLLLGFCAELLQKILREGNASPRLVIHRLFLLAHTNTYTPSGSLFVQKSYFIYDYLKLYTTYGV